MCYFTVTELEIKEGFLINPHASFIYYRNIEDVKTNTDDKAAKLYIDLKESTEIDNEAQVNLNL